jgi:hypothetical protein
LASLPIEPFSDAPKMAVSLKTKDLAHFTYLPHSKGLTPVILNRLESLADAISAYNRAHEPTSAAYQNRNPGQLQAISLKHSRDEHGARLFNAFIDGYQALLYDLRLKCSGASFAKLPPAACINDLMRSYGHQGALVGQWIAKYVTKALGVEIRATTELAYFLES